MESFAPLAVWIWWIYPYDLPGCVIHSLHIGWRNFWQRLEVTTISITLPLLTNKDSKGEPILCNDFWVHLSISNELPPRLRLRNRTRIHSPHKWACFRLRSTQWESITVTEMVLCSAYHVIEGWATRGLENRLTVVQPHRLNSVFATDLSRSLAPKFQDDPIRLNGRPG